MKQMKTAAALAIAAITMLAACGKEQVETPEIPDGKTSVWINFAYPDNARTRAEGALVTGKTAAFKPGHIIFTDATGQIITHVTIGKMITGVSSFTMDQLNNPAGSEVVVQNIPANVSRCYILSNDTAAKLGGASGFDTSLKGSNISSLLAASINVNNMNNNMGDLENVPMYGVGNVTVSPANSSTASAHTKYNAEVNVQINSLASHLQIKQFSVKDETINGNTYAITSYTVNGIYLNNVNPGMTVSGNLDTAVDNLSQPSNYSSAAGTTYAPTGSLSKMRDENNTVAQTRTMVAAPSAGAWGYNLFPQTTVPSIIVKLSSVTFTTNGANPQTIPGIQWLTISAFKENGTPVTSFKANQIYTLSDIKFKYSDLSTIPNAKKIDVLVKVTMFDWLNHEIVWGK